MIYSNKQLILCSGTVHLSGFLFSEVQTLIFIQLAGLKTSVSWCQTSILTPSIGWSRNKLRKQQSIGSTVQLHGLNQVDAK